MITDPHFTLVGLRNRAGLSRSTLVALLLQKIGTPGQGARPLIKMHDLILRIILQRVPLCGIIKCKTGSNSYSSSKDNMSPL